MSASPRPDEQLILGVVPLARWYARSRFRATPGPDRDDLVQEGMLALVRSVADFDPGRGGFDAFASTVLRRAMAGFLRGRREDRRLSLDAMTCGIPAAESPAASSDRRRAALAAVAGLPAEERRVLVLRYGLDDRPPRSIRRVAAELSIGPRRVCTLQDRAIRRLRDDLGRRARGAPPASRRAGALPPYVYPRGNRYRAVSWWRGRQVSLGTFDTPEEAAAAIEADLPPGRRPRRPA